MSKYISTPSWARWALAIGTTLGLVGFFALLAWLNAVFGMAGPLVAMGVVIAGLFTMFFYFCYSVGSEDWRSK